MYFTVIIRNIIGTKIVYNDGDCVVFLANLYHMGNGVTLNEKNRKVILARYGGEGKHSENYINYVFKHRIDDVNKYKSCKKKEHFFNHLIKNNIFFPIPEKKKDIQGVYSNLK